MWLPNAGSIFAGDIGFFMVAILVSGFGSLTLTPMLASRFLRIDHKARQGFFYNAIERFFSGMTSAYDYTLRIVLRRRVATLMMSFVVLGVTGWLFFTMPTGFIPSQDSGFFLALRSPGSTSPSIRWCGTSTPSTRSSSTILTNDESALAFVIGGNGGFLFMRLKPRDQRALSADQVIQELRPKLMSVPGILAFMQNPPPITVGGQQTQSLYQLTLQGADPRTLPGFADVTSDLQIASPQVTVDIDRDRAQTLGLTADQIQNALYTAYGTRQAPTIYTHSNEYAVITEVEPRYQRNPDALSKLYVRSAKGALVPLDEVVKLKRTVGPLAATHFGQLPSATISFNLRPGYALGDAAGQVENVIRDLRIPPTVTPKFQGTAQAFQESFKGLSILLIVAVLVIYMVLGMLYESFIHPLTILSGLPSAVFGALLTLKIFHKDLDLYAFVSLIMLFGVVKKNAIMMIDFAIEAQRLEGKSAFDAIYAGCLLRFRPIMMTTLAALFGTLPIALGIGEGADARQPLGLAVVGGLLFSQLLTLYITPMIYLYLQGISQGVGRISFKRRKPVLEAVAR